MQIGNVTLKNNIILAPMAGVTDLPFRLLCSEMGAGMVVSEMVSAKAVSYHNKNTAELLKTDPGEQPVALQLFGSDADIISEVAASLEELPFAMFDINMGCPVPKVAGNGEGSALMKDPQRVHDIVYKTSRAISKPLTIKIRAGFDVDHKNAPEIAKIAEDAGAAAVAVHGRTRSQYYAGTADWDIIRRVKEAVSIPVIGNGDVTDPKSAKALLEETGCDGIMVGRASRGNPWIFRRINEYLENGTDPGTPDKQQVVDMIMRHTRMMVDLKGENVAMREMRKHVAWYTTGMPNSSRLRSKVNQVETLQQMEELVLGEWQ